MNTRALSHSRALFRPLSGLSGLFALLVLLAGFTSHAADSATVKRLFADPPRDYASAPLWVWNDRLTEEQVRGTMRDLAGQQVKQVFVHPRPGLMTPYLSADWFRLWNVALDEAQRLDMNVWIYDENSYPSGFAGGFVPELMPESRGMGLHLRESKSAPQWETNTLAVFRLDGGKAENVSAKLKAGATFPAGRFVVAEIRCAGNSPWHGNRCYVNLLTPGVTEKFIEVTLEAYKREIGAHFGRRVPGVFTDEPEIRPAGGLPWCHDLPQQFEKRWGYSLLDHLASLGAEVGDWRRVRHNFFSTLNDLFIERWARPYSEWCETNGLAFTGHYWDHEWPRCVGVPDNMAMAAWQQIPGIDCLMNQYAEHTHAQFGNVRFCREIASIANQLGRKRTLVELYGAGGWDLRFQDMKRIADWLAVLGINLMDEHLSYVTIRGARKRDHPQSFSYHEPWWEAYHVHARYLARLSAVMSQGEQINRILVIEPTTTAWMYQGNEAKLRELGDSFFNLLRTLEAAQVEYDLGCEDVLARHGAVEGDKLRVGRRLYEVVVLPPHTENISSALLALGEDFLPAGVHVLCLGDPPERVDGAPSDRPAEGVNEPGWTSADPARAVELLARLAPPQGLRIRRAANDRGLLFHHRRHLDDGEILLLVNTSIEAPSTGTVESDRQGVECWNLHTGTIEPYPFERTDRGVKASFTLPPTGSLLLFLSNRPRPPVAPPRQSANTLAASGPFEIRRLQPNVLVLDYVDITAGGETRTNQYFYPANQFAWQKNGQARNPWDSAVQFKDELIRMKFPPESGFTASYRFTIEGAVPPNLAIVVERPDLYTITCNGQPVAAKPGEWWLDKAFGRISIASVARVGENVVTLRAQPFTIHHELEPAYLLGDFALKPAARGWIIAPDQPLRLAAGELQLAHDVNPDGTMWLSGGVGFTPGVEDRAPFVIFDLGKACDLAAIKVWNYNEAHVRDLTARGVESVRLSASSQGAAGPFDVSLGVFRLTRATGAAAPPDWLRVAARGIRAVRFDVLANFHGVRYPVSGDAVDNAFAGLAEVQFFDDRAEQIRGVTVPLCSSELASGLFARRARHLVDGSGLGATTGLGWNVQGHPFYAHGVAYRQSFKLDARAGRYVVSLPRWLGSVARVDVNGARVGYITSPPWECDVTPLLKAGDNTIQVVVFGTLKNLLGPHHGNPGLGSAWPGMFQQGPKDGPPAGERYHTVSYGLFEPFVLTQIVQK